MNGDVAYTRDAAVERWKPSGIYSSETVSPFQSLKIGAMAKHPHRCKGDLVV